jgi:choline-sulfatase
VPHGQPNILVVMCDQLTPSLTGAYGHPVVRTPNMDRLAREGVRFDAAYTPSPLCAPARASFMTGRYASSLGVYDNGAAFDSDVPTFAHYLTNAGYETVLSGKMHFVGADQLHGFRRRLTTDCYPSNFSWTARREPHVNHPGGADRVMATSYVTAGVRPWSTGLAYDAEVHSRALEFLRSRRDVTTNTSEPDPETPFCLVVSYHHPHDPFYVTQELWDEYDGAEIEAPELPGNLDSTYSQLDRWLNQWHGVEEVSVRDAEPMRILRRAYFGLVTDIDRKLGELVDALEESGLREDTVVIFTSDHGDMLGERGMIQKRHFYEQSARIPLLVELPGRWEGGREVAEPVSLLDLHATMSEIGGVTDIVEQDGVSLVPALDGGMLPDRPVISESHAEGIYAPCFMVRSGSHKLTYVHGHDRQLFDLDDDPGEWVNLVGSPETAAVEQALVSEIEKRFDPDAIERDIQASIVRRQTVRESMRRNEISWDYEARFDPRFRYWRTV